MARSCPEGRRWVEEYWGPERLQLLRGTDQALRHLRRQQMQQGKDLLEEVEGRLARLAETDLSVILVVQRFYWTARAYQDYCVGDHDQAAQALDRAHQAIVSAIEIAPFLLPLANHCHEFRLQHARVARSRRRWREMKEHLREVRAMLEDRAPLCTLSDGRAISLSTVTDFYRTIPSLGAEELEALRFFFDEKHRRDRIDRFLMGLYVLPGVVIPYP